ncbi:MAG TPA: ATP-binding cassette domain-containing protein [Gemmatimonadales bacterium]
MSSSAIEVRGLTRKFGADGHIIAVDNLSFDVPQGTLFGLVGPDGAGKTTTLRMLAGVMKPTAGEARLNGTFAYMSQRFGLYTDLTIRENIDFYADLYHVPKAERPARLKRLYEFSSLGEFEHRLAGQLSGGMKQKLALCCALIHHPDIMLLDEPTFGVDPISRRELWDIIRDNVNGGMTVIVTTSTPDEADRCDKVLYLGAEPVTLPPFEHEEPPVGKPAIQVKDLTRKFGDFTAVDHVSFEVAQGEIFGFLGPNGAGKTTTIKMLTGLLAPTSGTATSFGRLQIGYMSQLFSLYGDLTVSENIEFFGGLYEVTGERFRKRREWILQMSGLEHDENRPTQDLPLGWKHRLALGTAMIHEPPVLFLDEPTSGVDPVSRRNFWEIIAGLGATVLVTTHHMEEAEYCHRVALMNRGKLIALDTPAALKKSLGVPTLEEAFIKLVEQSGGQVLG